MKSHKFKPYYAAVAYLESLARAPHDQAYMHTHKQNPERFVERTRHFIKLLGSPHRGFRFIHISGTSGKGSTVAYTHEILRQAGFRVGSFTSPYATTSIEKIKVNDKLIDPLALARIVEKIKPLIQHMDKNYQYGRPSYFEIFFAIAILYFKKMKCDWVVLEVGCGGTYDAGMIIPKAIAVTTNIGLDHTKLLGNTLTKIAKEKAGIIRKNSHFFTTETRPNLLKIFEDECKKKNTKFHHISPLSTDAIPDVSPASLLSSDPFQQANASLAIAIARHIKIDEKIIKKAISSANLPPCRFEIVQKNPLVILDGAHNPSKMQSVVHNLKNLTYDKLYTIFASSDTKNARQMIKQLAPISDKIILSEIGASCFIIWRLFPIKLFLRHLRPAVKIIL